MMTDPGWYIVEGDRPRVRTLEETRRMLKVLADFDPYWIEDFIHPETPAEYAHFKDEFPQLRFAAGEQLALGGAAVVLIITFLLFAVILNTFFGPSDLAVAASISLVAIVWLKVEGRYDIGANYRLIVVLLGLAIAVPAAMALLYTLRIVITPGGLSRYTGIELLTHLSYWIGGGLAAVGAWWVWKGR